MAKWNREAPFHEGSLQHYPQTWGAFSEGIEWRPVEEFEDIMTYDSFTRGRSVAYLILTDLKGRKQPMFLAEFDSVIPHLVNGVVSGTWTVTKRGQNFGLKLVKAKGKKN